MKWIVALIERFSIEPRERALGRRLTRTERGLIALKWTSPLIAFVVIAFVWNAMNGTLYW